MKTNLSFILLVFLSLSANAQVGINTTTPDPSSILDVHSTDKGVLLPKVALNSNTDVITISSPAVGLLVYNTGSGSLNYVGYMFWNGSEWRSLQNATTATGLISNLNCSNATLLPSSYNAGVPYNGTLSVPYTGGNGGVYPAQSIGPVNGLTATLSSSNFNVGAGNLVYTISGTPTVTSPVTTSFNISIGGQSCSAIVGQGERGIISEYAQVRFDALTSSGITANGTYATLLPGVVNVARVKRISSACFRVDFIVPFQDANYIVSGQPFMPAASDGDAIMPYMFIGDYTTTANPFGTAIQSDTDDGPSGGLGLEPNVHNLNLGGAVRTVVKYRTHFYLWEGYGGFPIGGGSLNVTR